MEKSLAGLDKEVLVELVKIAQKNGMKGSSGGWKEFLAVHDKKLGNCLSDPARRSPRILVTFLKTITNKNDMQIISNIIRRNKNNKAMERFVNKVSDEESPEQMLVRLTTQHPRYTQCFSFPSNDEGWIITPLGKISKAMKSKVMIAIDCEMVLCEDGSEAVVRVCAVDKNFEVKLDQVVKPDMPIADYRTDITGVSSKDLEQVSCSLKDVQKSLKKILLFGTILIGHGLHNDLRALKIDHPRVIDTSCIFEYKDVPIGYLPSLNNLCKSVLGFQLRKEGEPHDCLNDAKAAMRLVHAKLEQGFNDPIAVLDQNIPKSELAKLFIHRIPLSVPLQSLVSIFSGDFKVDIQIDSRKRQSYSAFAVFEDSGEADEAFRKLEGRDQKDTTGRQQKEVVLRHRTGKSFIIKVRKMGFDALLDKHDVSKERKTENMKGSNGKQCPLASHYVLNKVDATDEDSREEDEVENQHSANVAEDVNGESAQKNTYSPLSSMVVKDMIMEAKSQDTVEKHYSSKKRVAEASSEDLKYEYSIGNNGSTQKVAEFTSEVSKKQKTCLDQCGHAKEIMKLRQELQRRDDEIFNLQKILSALMKK